MEPIETWEKIVIAVLVLLVLLWLRPGFKTIFERSREAEHKDWKGFLFPIVLVLLFVVLLIAMSR